MTFNPRDFPSKWDDTHLRRAALPVNPIILQQHDGYIAMGGDGALVRLLVIGSIQRQVSRHPSVGRCRSALLTGLENPESERWSLNL